MLCTLPLICRFKSQDLFNTEPFKPFIPGLKLWVFWAPIFISEEEYRLILSAKIK